MESRLMCEGFLGFPIFNKKSELQISKLKMWAAILKNHLNINL